jgi:hypothetical protein
VTSCCNPRGCDQFFSARFARRIAKRYRKRGLDKTARRMVGFLQQRGIEGATVLEVGGGIGEIQIELLLRAAAEHARRLVVFSYPRRNAVSRLVVAGQNVSFRLARKEFRTFAHPPSAMLTVLEDCGLRPTFAHHGLVWQAAGLVR